jgi:hypothetical protein
MSSEKYDQIIAAARAGKPADLLDVVGELVRDKGIDLINAKYSASASLEEPTAAEEEVETPAAEAEGEEQIDELSSKKVIGYAKAASADLDKRAEGGDVKLGDKKSKFAKRTKSLDTAVAKMSGTAKVRTTV